MTEEERTRELNNARRRAVNQARKDEAELVREGKGTRNWTPEQQREWIRTGSCKGYKGHHMLNVNEHPEYAGKLGKNKSLFIHHDIRPFSQLGTIRELDYEFSRYITWIMRMTEK